MGLTSVDEPFDGPPATPGPRAGQSRAKTAILDQLAVEGFSEGYAALVYMTVLVDTNPGTLSLRTARERRLCCAHIEGLRSALACVAMQEAKLSPTEAAEVVRGHISDAVQTLCAIRGTE